MSLQRKFLHTRLKHTEITVYRFLAGLLLGLMFAFSFYAFLQCLTGTIRVLSLMSRNNPMIMESQAASFVHRFFAVLSTIFGQSVTISWWLDRPRQFLQKDNYLQRTIVLDQRNLKWVTIHYMGKMFVFLFLSFALSFPCVISELGILENYWVLLALLPLVLFLNSWLTLRRVFGNKSWKWMGISALVICLFAFGLSKIQLIPYEEVNKVIVRQSPILKYNIQLPGAESSQIVYDLSLTRDFYVAFTPEAQQKNTLIINNKESELSDMDYWIRREKQGIPWADADRMLARAYIDKRVRMKYVMEVRENLLRNRVSKVSYSVAPPGGAYSEECVTGNVLGSKFPYYFDLSTALYYFTNASAQITIRRSTGSKSYYINNELCTRDRIHGKIKSMLTSYPGTVIKYDVNDEETFEDYIFIRSSLLAVVEELRDQKFMELADGELEYIHEYHLRDSIEEIYPLRMFETSEKMYEDMSRNAYLVND